MPVPVTRRAVLRRAAVGAAVTALAGTGLLAVATPAGAATGTPIVYRLRATATGTLDGTSFTNALVTMKQVTNTADVNDDNGEYINTGGTITVTVANVGTDRLTAGSSDVGDTGFPDGDSFAFCVNGGNLFRFCGKSSKLSNFHMDRPFGPVTGGSYVYPYRGASTTRGYLLLTSAGTATFNAWVPKS